MRHAYRLGLALWLVAGACAETDDGVVDDAGRRDDAGVEDVVETDGGADGDLDVTDLPEIPDVPDGCEAAPCLLDERRCDPPPADDTIYRVCEAGPDGCARWSDQQSCPAGQFCQEGLCVESCTDICVEGALQCLSDTEWQTCERGARGCLTWGAGTACPSGEVCTGAGVCAACADECLEGLARCSTDGAPAVCAVGGAGCLAWVESPACPTPQYCWEGACVDRCSDVCTSGQMRCFGTDYQICMRQPAGCYGWGTPYRCPGGRACVGAGICPSCTDTCTDGEGRCDTSTSAVRCQLDERTGCWVWSPSTPCGLHEACEGSGVCTTICTDDCPAEGTLECGPGGGPRQCVVGALGCLEWSVETPCEAVEDGSNVCVAGACDLTCAGGFLECGPTSCRLSCAPWSQQSPVPPYENLWALDFVGTSVWTAGNAGAVARSDDRGVTWRNAGSAPGGAVLNAIDFVSATRGWTVGNGGAILRSDDGGGNWFAQTSGVTDALRGVSFVDASTGWVVGDAGVILATTDGGTTWTRQTSGLTTALFAVHFVNATTGWAVGAGGRILKTADGGRVWLPQTSGTTLDIRAVRFLDVNTGWAVGHTYAYRTTNGGTTWGAYARSAIQYNAIFGTTANAVLIVGAGGRVETTTDGGLSWSVRTSGTTANLHALVFHDALNAVTVGANGLVLTSANGGSTWIERRGGTVDNLRDVFFADATHGWAVGAAGRIVATTDGGAAWTPQVSGTTSNLWGLWFADATTGWAVGEAGTIRATTDGGASWAASVSGTTGALYDVMFLDTAEGWAVGAYAAGSSVRYTPDGGATWMAEPTGIPTTITMYGVWFNPSGHGWVVGTSGTVRYTTDRGVNWRTPGATGTTQTLWDVRFVGDNVGFAVGGAGALLVTADGGLTWALRGTPATGILYDLAFVDALHGFIVGAAGTFLKTVDGGTNWTSHPATTSRDLRGVGFLTADDGWVAGDYGTILRTFSGGE